MYTAYWVYLLLSFSTSIYSLIHVLFFLDEKYNILEYFIDVKVIG